MNDLVFKQVLAIIINGLAQMRRKQVEQLMLAIKEWYSVHWRDDDSPQSETTFGVC